MATGAETEIKIPDKIEDLPPATLYSLGYFFETGETERLYGIEKDEVKARKYYQLAAASFFGPAESKLANFYRDGRGELHKDEEESTKYKKRAEDYKTHSLYDEKNLGTETTNRNSYIIAALKKFKDYDPDTKTQSTAVSQLGDSPPKSESAKPDTKAKPPTSDSQLENLPPPSASAKLDTNAKPPTLDSQLRDLQSQSESTSKKIFQYIFAYGGMAIGIGLFFSSIIFIPGFSKLIPFTNNWSWASLGLTGAQTLSLNVGIGIWGALNFCSGFFTNYFHDVKERNHRLFSGLSIGGILLSGLCISGILAIHTIDLGSPLAISGLISSAFTLGTSIFALESTFHPRKAVILSETATPVSSAPSLTAAASFAAPMLVPPPPTVAAPATDVKLSQ